jgi:hypothetical protein
MFDMREPVPWNDRALAMLAKRIEHKSAGGVLRNSH